MRSRRSLLSASCLLLGSLAVAAGCGGGGEETPTVSLGQIVTATLPNPLPEATILAEVAAPVVDGTSYTVQPGDILAAIADRFGTTVEAIAAANAIENPSSLEVGQVLVIPGGTQADEPDEVVLAATQEPPATPTPSTGPEPTQPPPVPGPNETTYIVQAGEYADLIARRFGVTLDELAAANNTTVDDLASLQIGDVLIIPSPSTSATPAP